MPRSQDADLRHSAYYLNVLSDADEAFQQGGEAMEEGLRLFEMAWNNIRGGQTRSRDYSEIDPRAAELCSNYSMVGANLLILRFDPREHIRWIEAGLSIARRTENIAAEAIH